MAPSATILHHHGFPRRSGAAPSTVNTGPRAPIFEYVGHQHVPQAWRPHIGAAQARYGFYCHRNTRYVKINRKIMVASFLPSWLQSAPMARLGALLCAQYRPTSAHIRVCWPRTCVPRMYGGKNGLGQSVTANLRSPWAIWVKNNEKLWLLSAPTLKKSFPSQFHGPKDA